MKAVLDACVVYPTVLREILTGVAARGLYEPLWSERILREWVLATAKLGPVAQMQAEGAALRMRANFPRAMTRAQGAIEARLLLPDAGDVHVLAEEGIARRDPDGLLWELWSDQPDVVGAVVAGVHAEAERLAGQVLPLKALMKRAQLPKLAKAMLAER